MEYRKDDNRGNCVCGHNHIYYVGDLGKDEDEEGYDLIPSCVYCDCENFKRL
jgi:hypothetical protein